jgi:hypothetical protein
LKVFWVILSTKIQNKFLLENEYWLKRRLFFNWTLFFNISLKQKFILEPLLSQSKISQKLLAIYIRRNRYRQMALIALIKKIQKIFQKKLILSDFLVLLEMMIFFILIGMLEITWMERDLTSIIFLFFFLMFLFQG